jgi:YspA, cpYpsA-related SLOG family
LKVIVCGGRDETSKDYVWRGLDTFHREKEITAIAHGGARGVDALTYEWAAERKIGQRIFKAAWKTAGLRAGPLRNQQMLDAFQPDFVIAFCGGRGTADMVRKAMKAGVKVHHVFRHSTMEPPR